MFSNTDKKTGDMDNQSTPNEQKSYTLLKNGGITL